MELETELGNKAKEILMSGEAISEEMAVKFMEEKVESVEVAHHGKSHSHS
jgi:adenylate/nucleoside-diphosphate kinase